MADRTVRYQAGRPVQQGTVLHDDGRTLIDMRVCCFAHYDPQPFVDPTVFHYLQAISNQGFCIVFVSTAPYLSPDIVEDLAPFCSRVLLRSNEGLDFASWKCAFVTIPEILQADELLLANDSVWLIKGLAPVFAVMEPVPCDFWGMTASQELTPHLQSYFLYFRQKALQSNTFRIFWDSVVIYADKKLIIARYEGLLTLRLALAGLTPAAFFSSGLKKSNPSIANGLSIIQQCGMPLLKRELLRDNPRGVDLHTLPLYLDAGACSFAEIKQHLARLGTPMPEGVTGKKAVEISQEISNPAAGPVQFDILLPLVGNAPNLWRLLSSLTVQQKPGLRLLVGEDNCGEADRKAVRDFAALHNVQRIDTGGLGPVGILDCLLRKSDAPYFLIADPRCEWLPEKTTTLLQAMAELEEMHGPDKPLLVYSDARPSKLRHPTVKTLRKELGLPAGWGKHLTQSFICCPAPAFTMMGNAALRKAALPLPEPNVAVEYAWWMFLVSKALGAVKAVEKPLMTYTEEMLSKDQGGRRSPPGKSRSKGCGRLRSKRRSARRLAAALLLRHRTLMEKKTLAICEVAEKTGLMAKHHQLWYRLQFGFVRHELHLLASFYTTALFNSSK